MAPPVGEVPNPALVLIMSMDNDIRCDGTDGDNVAPLGESFTAVLDEIVEAAPETHIVILASQNRPATFVDALIARDDPLIPGDSICELFTEDGRGEPRGHRDAHRHHRGLRGRDGPGVRHLRPVHQRHRCGGQAPIGPDSIAADQQHSSVQGHRELAEAVWPVVEEALGL